MDPITLRCLETQFSDIASKLANLGIVCGVSKDLITDEFLCDQLRRIGEFTLFSLKIIESESKSLNKNINRLILAKQEEENKIKREKEDQDQNQDQNQEEEEGEKVAEDSDYFNDEDIKEIMKVIKCNGFTILSKK